MRKKIKKRFWQVKTMKTEFSSGTLTNYSGILPIYQFMQKLNIFNSLEQNLDLPLHHNAKYTTGQIVSLATMGMLSGLNRISKFEKKVEENMTKTQMDEMKGNMRICLNEEIPKLIPLEAVIPSIFIPETFKSLEYGLVKSEQFELKSFEK